MLSLNVKYIVIFTHIVVLYVLTSRVTWRCPGFLKKVFLESFNAGTGGNYSVTQNDGGQGDPFRAASHFLGHAGTGSFMQPTLVPSLGPISQGLQNLPGAMDLQEDSLEKFLTLQPQPYQKLTGIKPVNLCFMNFAQKCPFRAPRTS